MKKTKQELEQEIADLKAKMEQLEKEEKSGTRSTSEYTDKEKIAFFNKMYESAEAELKDYEKKEYHDDDYAHYAWEEYIHILAKDREAFWKYWNSIGD